ncbi:V-set and immunoglobulin domain-containing protein 8-like [Heteronotia binoei]|uniref:V-set and immunoglobulin domain-containing protein 8-like n=1 Tax=Heteronotia binoei TaxID=13085 RepID=UPI002931732B|nr:V-set and immunoglobulin domain-containing protein 8-like [Heteronotia binoei]
MTHKRLFRFVLLCIISALSSAVRITDDGQKIIYLPRGESVKLGCPFSTDPEDNTPDSAWDIQWTQVKPGQYPQSNPLLSYHDHQIVRPGPPDLQQRVGFTSADPSLYDASMQLRDVQVTDSATYECTVKKTTEATHKVTIAVQERPAVPQCLIVGEVDYGNDITLRCFASAGSPPLTYRWTMTHGSSFRDWMSPSDIGSVPGDFHIFGLREEHLGTYRCSVTNNVGVAYCTVDITIGGWSRMWIIGGSVLCGVLGTALMIGFISWGIWCCRGSGVSCYCGDRYCWDCCWGSGDVKEDEPEYQGTKGNDIRVDAEAPPSRPGSQAFSRASSMHSLIPYQTRNGVQYTKGRKHIPPIVQVKMTSPPASELSLILAADIQSPNVSDQSDELDPIYIKGRSAYAPVNSSPIYTKGRQCNNSPSPAQIYTDPRNYNPPSDSESTQWNDRSTPRSYNGAVVMMRSASKEGLLI